EPALASLVAEATENTIIYGPRRSRLAWRSLVAKVKNGVLLRARYAHPNLEGTADPLASVVAKSRLMSVVQEFRDERNETGSRIGVQQPTDECVPLPVWSARSGCGSEASLRARLLSRGYTRGICPRAEAEGIRPSGTHRTEALPFLRLPRGPGSGHGA